MRLPIFICILIGLGMQGYAQMDEDLNLAEVDSIWKNVLIDEDVVITGEIRGVSQKNAIHQVRTIDQQEIRSSGYNNLAELMSQQLNMGVTQDAILGSGIEVQGIGGENVAILIDGVPVVGRLNGNIDLSQIRLDNVLRVEMVQGAMSAQYGSNASGGVINIITKKSQLHKFQVQSSHHIESRGIHDHSFSVGMRKGNWHSSFGGSRYQIQIAPVDSLRLQDKYTLEDGTVEERRRYPWNPKTQYNAFGQVRYMSSDSFSIRLKSNYFHEELVRYDEVRRPFFLPYSLDEYYTTQRLDLSADLEWHLSPNVYLSSVSSFNSFDRDRVTQRLDFDPDTTSEVASLGNEERFTNLLHRSILTSTASCPWNGQIGVEYLREQAEGQRLSEGESDPSQYTMAAWASIRYEPTDRWSVVANIRSGYNSEYNHPWLPSIHALWKVNRDTRLRASYARGFRAPSLKELHFNFIDANHFILGNPDLEAETSTNIQMLYEQSIGGENLIGLDYSVGLFYNDIRDRIFLAPVDLTTLEYSYINVENFSTHGVQVQLNWLLGKHLRWNMGYGLNRIHNGLGDDILEERYDERHEVTSQLVFSEPHTAVELTLRHRYVGAQQLVTVTEAADVQIVDVADYHLTDLNIGRDVWEDRFRLNIGVKNLFDLSRIDSQQTGNSIHADGGGFLVGIGRTFYARVQMNLSRK